MNDETTLPGLIGAPIRYREVGTVQWYEVPLCWPPFACRETVLLCASPP